MAEDKFTDRFMELPYFVYDGKTQEITGKPVSEMKLVSQKRKIDILRIESYEQAMPANLGFDEKNGVATEVNMQSGHSFVVDVSFNEFENKINNFYNKNKSNNLNTQENGIFQSK